MNSQNENLRTGLVLSMNECRENDGIVHLLSEDEVIGFYARGIQKSTSRNRRLCEPFNEVTLEFDPKYSRDLLYLIHGTLDQSYACAAETLENQSISALCTDLIERHGGFSGAGMLVKRLWQALEQSDLSKAVLYACVILVQILKKEGIVMNVQGCSVCGRQDKIAGFSTENGGFVCVDHTGLSERWHPQDLLKLRHMVNASRKSLPKLEQEEWDLSWLFFFMDWYEYQQASLPASSRYLRQLQKNRKTDITK